MSGQSTGRCVTMQEAADELGLTGEAIRKRVQRGSIASDKGPDGRRHVYLNEAHREVQDESTALVEEMRDRIRLLEEQLRREQDAHSEARRLLGALIQRIPKLEPPQEPAEPRSCWQRVLGR